MIRLDKARPGQISSDNFLTCPIRFNRRVLCNVLCLGKRACLSQDTDARICYGTAKDKKTVTVYHGGTFFFAVISDWQCHSWYVFHLGELTDVDRNFVRRCNTWKNSAFPEKFGWILGEKTLKDCEGNANLCQSQSILL